MRRLYIRLIGAVTASAFILPLGLLMPRTVLADETGTAAEETQFVPDTEGAGGFVARMYTVVLGRPAEEAGYNAWLEVLRSGSDTGAGVARGFLESSEFRSKGLDNEQYVTVLYNLFFDRAPDAEGLAAWVALLDSGAASEEILDGFINSTEWANTCLVYGIRSGGTGTPDIQAPVTEGMENFVRALYSECLGRTPADNEVAEWTGRLATGTSTGKSVAYGFFFSPEFRQKSALMSDEELITVFYTVFLGRTPDYAGLNAWERVISWGDKIEILFTGFADSSEFAAKCAAYGVICGDHIDVGASSDSLDEDFIDFAENCRDIQRGIQRIDSAPVGPSRRTYILYNVQGAETTSREVTISDGDIAAIERFASEHFLPNWTNGQKLAYTCWWINTKVTYARSGAWNVIAGKGYAEAIFNHRLGQCAQYNGAMIEMMCWMGYDACMIQGYRMSSSGNTFQHFWGEVNLNGTVYVVENGNFGDSGYWHFFICEYSETTKFVKNGSQMN